MTQFAPHLAAIRFGTGRSPKADDPASVNAMLRTLRSTDKLAATFPIDPLSSIAEEARAIRQRDRDVAQGNDADKAEAKAAKDAFFDRERANGLSHFGATLARAVAAPDGFRDRLTWFWADHFAVEGRGLFLRYRTDTYADEAIRPHLAGSFAELLRAAALHPVMLQFLDQTSSIGPNSRTAKRQGDRGLNENLAREILELHTLGVQGGYTQTDVRQFAELLSGVGLNGRLETQYFEARAEPGSETVLGFTSSAKEGQFEDVAEFLDRLAVHPDTARHIAKKLAIHFVSDTPDPDLVTTMERRWLETDGDLAEVYRAMLEHPTSWSAELQKVKRPIEFVVSTLRALDVPAARVARWSEERPVQFNRWIGQPMQRMGQRWTRPGGPDGWPETAEAWITPNTLAERLRWVLRIQDLPRLEVAEPRAVLDAALGPLAHSRLRLAVDGAETREEAVALALLSPEFQRR